MPAAGRAARLCLQHLPRGNCLSPPQLLLQYTSFYHKSPPREVLGHKHQALGLVLPSCSPQIRLQQLWGHAASFPLPVLRIYVTQREEIPHTHTQSHAHPPNSSFSNSNLERLKHRPQW